MQETVFIQVQERFLHEDSNTFGCLRRTHHFYLFEILYHESSPSLTIYQGFLTWYTTFSDHQLLFSSDASVQH